MILAAGLTSTASAWLIIVSTCLAVMATVGGTSWRLIRWMQRQEDRWNAVDVVAADWERRGITPQGAVIEAEKYRNSTDTNTAAIAGHEARLNAHDDRLAATDQKLDHVVARVDEIAVVVRKST